MSGSGRGRSGIPAAAAPTGTQNIQNRQEDDMTRTKRIQKQACTIIKKFAKGDLSLKIGEEKTIFKQFPEVFSCFKYLDEDTIVDNDLLFHFVCMLGIKDAGTIAGKSKAIKKMLQKQASVSRTNLMRILRSVCLCKLKNRFIQCKF